jgi:hypothetical protein
MTDGVVKIHGREYKTVAKRVAEFKEQYPDWSIVTELVSANDETVVMKALVLDQDQRIRGTGYAEEKRSASKINQTSAMENAETSAIGRALASGCGLAGTEYASADEVANAIAQQNIAEQVNEQVARLMAHNTAVRENWETVAYMKTAFHNQDALAFAEAWLELESDEVKEALYLAPTKGGVFTTEERAFLRSNEVNAARKEIING